MSEREFRKEFVTTYTATAINPLSRHAKDESLHEIDTILPKNIYWVGYLQIDDKRKIPKKIYIGGDSKYGFGLMKLIDTVEENYPYNVKKGVYQDSYPNPILNFVKFENQSFEGEIELLAKFEANMDDYIGKVATVKAFDVQKAKDESYTLFLPRFVEFRDDKIWMEADTIERILEISEMSKSINSES